MHLFLCTHKKLLYNKWCDSSKNSDKLITAGQKPTFFFFNSKYKLSLKPTKKPIFIKNKEKVCHWEVLACVLSQIYQNIIYPAL